jgi:hypothetical protein
MRKFKTIISETFVANKEKILEFINNNRVTYENLINDTKLQKLYISVYNLKYDLEYDKLKNLILEINIRI